MSMSHVGYQIIWISKSDTAARLVEIIINEYICMCTTNVRTTSCSYIFLKIPSGSIAEHVV